MASVRELSSEETHLAARALLELRPHLDSGPHVVATINDTQRRQGYRLVASFDDGSPDAVAVAGFRNGHNLAWGHYLYVDDLVTCEPFRGRGHAAALMQWLVAEAARLGCDQLHLDSGTGRHDAHRFYLNHELSITSFHFARTVPR